MRKASTSAPFRIFERVVIGLYDGGVLSPAVLERVIGAFAQAGADWHDAPRAKSVDDRSLHEIVVRTMLPGDALESPSGSFRTIVEHIGGAALLARVARADAENDQPARARTRTPASADEDNDNDNDNESAELLAQLSGGAQPDKPRRSKKTSPPGRSKGFNPFLNAALPRSKKS